MGRVGTPGCSIEPYITAKIKNPKPLFNSSDAPRLRSPLVCPYKHQAVEHYRLLRAGSWGSRVNALVQRKV